MQRDDNPYVGDAQSIRLTHGELEHVHHVVDDRRAMNSEHVIRFAQPHERNSVAENIDPTTATVFFQYTDDSDPYGERESVGKDSSISLWGA
jgi:hypothetical protein